MFGIIEILSIFKHNEQLKNSQRGGAKERAHRVY